jgi:GntR family transcriptional regulator, transcriptional repressor for pyruvate dehydrogenase complex
MTIPALRFEPIDHSPAYRRVADAIETKILSQELKPGDALPAEIALAAQFGVHRSTMREAIRELESQGLIGRAPGAKRLQVTRPQGSRISADMSRALSLHSVTFLELWEGMMAIGPAAASAAARRRSATQLGQLRRSVAQFREAGRDTATAIRAETDFFAAVSAASGNRVFVFAQDALNSLLAPSLLQMIDKVPQARQRIGTAQTRILEAIVERRAEDAAAWMTRHVKDFKRGYELAKIPLQAPARGASRRASN